MRKRSMVCLGCSVALACHSAPLPPGSQSGPAGERLPRLALHHLSTTVDNSPRGLWGGFTIGPQGLLFNQDDRGDGLLFSVLDSMGTVIRRVGRKGDGPAEVRDGVIDVSDSSFIVGGLRPRLSRFSLDGALIESSTLTEQVFPRIAASDREVIASRAERAADFPVIITVGTGRVRPLVTGADSFLRSFPPQRLLPDGSVKLPVLGRWSGGFIAADGFEYRLALYSWDGELQRILGRDLPPPTLSVARVNEELQGVLPLLRSRRKLGPADIEQQRAEIAARRRPYFVHNRSSQIGLDGEGRIWVVGIDADSGFADLFSATRFLGRLPLPCPGFQTGWSLKGSWFVLACKPTDPAFDGDAVFKVFRIVD